MSTHLYDINTLAYLNLSEKEATEKLEADGYIVRVVYRDGKLMDAEPGIKGNRANIEVKDGKVFEISIG
jgi:hypothetical protein